MPNTKIVPKKTDGVWYWFNEAKNSFVRPISINDESFKKLNPKIRFEIRQYNQHKVKDLSVASKNNKIHNKYKELNAYLKDAITGQNKVIDKWTQNLAGHEFNATKQPNIALMLGPTGVGKTYLATKTNEFLNQNEDNCLVLECNNPKYQNPNYDKANLEEIADFIKNHPNGIIILDEFEKAILNGNPSFLYSFLNIFDAGYIKDRDGKKFSCSDNTFIMTSNVGSQYLLLDDKFSMRQVLEQIFPPEFLGRISNSIYYFAPLKFKDFENATKLLLNNVEEGMISKQLDRRGIKINFDDESIKNIVLASCGVFHNMDELLADETVWFNQKPTEAQRRLVSYHEAGHAVCKLATQDPEELKRGDYKVKKIQNLPSGGAGGYTIDIPDNNIPNKEQMIKECCCLYAGRAAEKIFCAGDVSMGWENDKSRINNYIANILLHFDPEFSQYISEEYEHVSEATSFFDDKTQTSWNKKFKELERKIEKDTEQILSKHKKEIELFSQAQLIKGVVDAKEIRYIWENKKLPESVLEIQKKSKEEQAEIRINNGSEPISNSAGVRGIKNWINNNLVFQFQELYESGKIKDNTEVNLKVDEDGKLSIGQPTIKKQKQK